MTLRDQNSHSPAQPNSPEALSTTSPDKLEEHRYGQGGVVVSPLKSSNDELSSPEEELENRGVNAKKRLPELSAPLRRSRPVYVSA